jgi:protocatechuate 3,4-dioxygenase beta subunit
MNATVLAGLIRVAGTLGWMARPAAVLVVLVGLALGSTTSSDALPSKCRATAPDSLGPFYEPGAPVRSRVGTGYLLRGRVLSATTCRPVRRARIEFWLVNEQGEYDDAHRATVFAGTDGRYRFQSNRPVGYASRPPHIHVRVTARGYRALVTQHYPRAGRARAVFNLVLRPRQ